MSAAGSWQVWSVVPTAYLANVRFLAGYRRGGMFASDLLSDAAVAARRGLTLGDVERVLSARWTLPVARAALMRLLWAHRLSVDLTRPLSRQTIVEGAS